MMNYKARIAAALLCAAMAVAACGCGSGTQEQGEQTSAAQTTVSAEPVQTDTAPATVPTEPAVTSADITSAQESEITAAGTDMTGADEEVSIEELDLSAPRCLELLNSDHVHAKLIEAVSYDNEETSSIEREYYVDGENAVYINGSQKIIMDADTVTVADLDNMTYYRYERQGGEGSANFGYGIDNYSFYFTETSSDGTRTEVYNVSAHGGTLVSTWTFFPSGTITVSDVSPEFGSYYWYSFELIETDVSGMDMGLPDGMTEVEYDDSGM